MVLESDVGLHFVRVVCMLSRQSYLRSVFCRHGAALRWVDSVRDKGLPFDRCPILRFCCKYIGGRSGLTRCSDQLASVRVNATVTSEVPTVHTQYDRAFDAHFL